MKTKQIIVVLCVVLVIVLAVTLFLTGQNHSTKTLTLVKDKSYFGEFYVSDNSVFIRCEITLNNISSEKMEFEMYANFPEDVDLGLLINERLMAYSNDELRRHKFEIDANSIKTFSVIFVGEYAGNMKKHDRNLPEIEIIVIN